MKIEKLEALERAATAGPCELYNDEWTCAIKVGEVYMQAPYQPPHGRGECSKWRADGAVFAAARNALPSLLAVAKAARVLSKWTEAEIDGTIKLRDDTYANNALADLCESLAQLEATP